MKHEYREMMEQITLTPEMKARILQNVEQGIPATPKKVIRFSTLKKFTTLAACLALLVASPFVMEQLSPAIDPPPVQVIHDIKNFSTVELLSDSVGFDVEQIELPAFPSDTIKYKAYHSELAELTYQGEHTALTFRKSRGADDNSGDYIQYNDVKRLSLNDTAITIKGNSTDSFNLATWNRGDFSYSLRTTDGLDQQSFSDLLLTLL